MEAEHPDASEQQEPVTIPHTDLSAELLRAVIESLVLREGTDYGEHEVSLDDIEILSGE